MLKVMIQVSVKREHGKTLLILKPKDRVSYKTHCKLIDNRFYIPDFDQHWIWRGPDTQEAEELAQGIADTFNLTEHERFED